MSQNSLAVKAVLPYAEALLDSSQEIQLLDETSENLNFILESVEKSSHLKSFLANPLLGAEAKKAVLRELFVKQVSHHVLNFLYILVDRRRIVLLQPIIQCYFDLVCNLQLVLVAEVSTACPLTESQKQALQVKLKDMTNSSKIQLVESVDWSQFLSAGLLSAQSLRFLLTESCWN
jgi:F-type H+-transporting ATPase subunit delta